MEWLGDHNRIAAPVVNQCYPQSAREKCSESLSFSFRKYHSMFVDGTPFAETDEVSKFVSF